MKRKLNTTDDNGDGGSRDLSSRIMKPLGNAKDGMNPVKKIGLLKSIGSLTAIAVPLAPVPVVASDEDSGHEKASKSHGEAGADVQYLNHIPEDMVVRKSVTIEANFDLRNFLRELRQKCTHSTKGATTGLWKFEMSSKLMGSVRDTRDSSLGQSKKSLQGDKLWLHQTRSRGEDRNENGIHDEGVNLNGDGVRSHVICWQEALCSLTSQFLAGATPLFYVVGQHSNPFRAIFYRSEASSLNPASETCMECIIHRCTNGIFDDLKNLGIPVNIIGAPGTMDRNTTPKANQFLDASYKEREKNNIFSSYTRKSKNNTTDKIIHLSGLTAIMAVIDSISQFFLPLSTISYYRIAEDLPSLVANTNFSHGVPSHFVATSFSSTVVDINGDKVPTSTSITVTAQDNDLDTFHDKYLLNHDGMRTLTVYGDMSTSFVEYLAVMLRNCAIQSSRRAGIGKYRDTTGNILQLRSVGTGDNFYSIEKSFINANIFKFDKNKLKAVDDFTSGYRALNPFQLQTSNPEDDVKSLIDDAKKRLNTFREEGDSEEKIEGNKGGSESDGINTYFTIQLSSTPSDFSISLAQTVGKDLAVSASPLTKGAIVTDVAWYEEDEEEDLFEVSFFSMQALSACSVSYNPH